jgi:hypothetical protein
MGLGRLRLLNATIRAIGISRVYLPPHESYWSGQLHLGCFGLLRLWEDTQYLHPAPDRKCSCCWDNLRAKSCDKFSRAALSSEIASIELGEYMSGYDFTETTRGTTAAHITKGLYDGMEIRTRGLAWDEVPLHWSRGARHEAWPWW